MSIGARRFFTLCGDGSALVRTIGEAARRSPAAAAARSSILPRTRSTEPARDSATSGISPPTANHVRRGHLRREPGIHTPLVDRGIRKRNAVGKGPIMQPVAIQPCQATPLCAHASLRPQAQGWRLRFSIRRGHRGLDFDLDTKRRLKRIPLKHVTSGLAVSQDTSPPSFRRFDLWGYGPDLRRRVRQALA